MAASLYSMLDAYLDWYDWWQQGSLIDWLCQRRKIYSIRWFSMYCTYSTHQSRQRTSRRRWVEVTVATVRSFLCRTKRTYSAIESSWWRRDRFENHHQWHYTLLSDPSRSIDLRRVHIQHSLEWRERIISLQYVISRVTCDVRSPQSTSTSRSSLDRWRKFTCISITSHLFHIYDEDFPLFCRAAWLTQDKDGRHSCRNSQQRRMLHQSNDPQQSANLFSAI